MTTDETVALFTKYAITTYARVPVVVVRGEGSFLWDADGRRYLDLFPGWGSGILGHCHPAVVSAIRAQAGKLLHVPNTFYSEPQGLLAQLLSESSFGGQCFFCNSGAEAVEGANKLARAATPAGRYKVVTLLDSFHGRTLAAMTATGQPQYQRGFEPLPSGFPHIPLNDIAALEAALDEETAAVMVEPIQGEGGVNIASEEFMHAARELTRQRGVLFIVDEVTTGMGRTGDFFAYQHYGIEPDVMTLAKGLGGGVAIGAVVARAECAAALKPGMHASTFGGNALACAAAVATMETIEKEGLLERARKLGTYTMEWLTSLARELGGLIVEVRGRGLMVGVELSRPGADIVRECLRRGLLINCTHERVLRLYPALTVGQDVLDQGLDILAGVLRDADQPKRA
jgi:acetylornithine/N-succinyldiaminopimelate aminotransferase